MRGPRLLQRGKHLSFLCCPSNHPFPDGHQKVSPLLLLSLELALDALGWGKTALGNSRGAAGFCHWESRQTSRRKQKNVSHLQVGLVGRQDAVPYPGEGEKDFGASVHQCHTKATNWKPWEIRKDVILQEE